MFFLQRGQEIEHLRLDRDVEGGGGLVRNQELGVAGKRHRDHGALRHAAGELVRVVVGALGGAGDADVVEQFDGARSGLPPRHALVHAQGLGDLVLDGERGIQARTRLLEDHADLVAADAVQIGRRHPDEFAAIETNRPGDDAPGLPEQPHHRHGGHRLAAPGFPDEADRASGVHLEADAAHDGEVASARGGELDREVRDLEQRRAGCVVRPLAGPWRGRSRARPAPVRRACLDPRKRIAQAVPDQVEGEHAEHDHQPRRGDHERMLMQVVLGRGQHHAPARLRRLHAEPDVGQARLGEQHVREGQGRLHGEGAGHVRQHVAEQDAARRRAAHPGGIHVHRFAHLQRRAAHQAEERGGVRYAEGDHGVRQARSEDREDGDGDQQRGQRDDRFDDAHRDAVPPAAEIP